LQKLALPGNPSSLKARVMIYFREKIPRIGTVGRDSRVLAVAPCACRKTHTSSLGQPKAQKAHGGFFQIQSGYILYKWLYIISIKQ